MIKTISIENYKSICKLTLDLTYAEGKAPNGWQKSTWLPFVGKPSDGRFVPILAIYGANASGKSNILDGLKSLQEVIHYGIEGKFHPNRLADSFNILPTKFRILLKLLERTFIYEISYDERCICKETLECENEFLYAIEEGKLLSEGFGNENYPLNKLSSILDVECHNAKGEQTKTFLYCLFKGYAGLSNELNVVYSEITENLVVMGDNDIHLSKGASVLAGSSKAASLQIAFDEILVYLKKFDIHIEKMVLERFAEAQSIWSLNKDEFMQMSQNQDNTMIFKDGYGQVQIAKITSYHQRTDGKIEPFNFYSEESQGTRLLAGILGIILDTLKNGKRLFVDELDRSLHPLLLVQIVRMFKSKKLNTKSAQLIFTLHETTLLEDPLLRLSEVGILNNNLQAGTTLARLSDYHQQDKSIRNVNNFRKRYLEGIYAGIPEPIL